MEDFVKINIQNAGKYYWIWTFCLRKSYLKSHLKTKAFEYFIIIVLIHNSSSMKNNSLPSKQRSSKKIRELKWKTTAETTSWISESIWFNGYLWWMSAKRKSQYGLLLWTIYLSEMIPKTIHVISKKKKKSMWSDMMNNLSVRNYGQKIHL